MYRDTVALVQGMKRLVLSVMALVLALVLAVVLAVVLALVRRLVLVLVVLGLLVQIQIEKMLLVSPATSLVIVKGHRERGQAKPSKTVQKWRYCMRIPLDTALS